MNRLSFGRVTLIALLLLTVVHQPGAEAETSESHGRKFVTNNRHFLESRETLMNSIQRIAEFHPYLAFSIYYELFEAKIFLEPKSKALTGSPVKRVGSDIAVHEDHLTEENTPESFIHAALLGLVRGRGVYHEVAIDTLTQELVDLREDFTREEFDVAAQKLNFSYHSGYGDHHRSGSLRRRTPDLEAAVGLLMGNANHDEELEDSGYLRRIRCSIVNLFETAFSISEAAHMFAWEAKYLRKNYGDLKACPEGLSGYELFEEHFPRAHEFSSTGYAALILATPYDIFPNFLLNAVAPDSTYKHFKRQHRGNSVKKSQCETYTSETVRSALSQLAWLFRDTRAVIEHVSARPRDPLSVYAQLIFNYQPNPILKLMGGSFTFSRLDEYEKELKEEGWNILEKNRQACALVYGMKFDPDPVPFDG